MVNKTLAYIVGGVLSAAGLTFYILGTVLARNDFLQPGFWMFSSGMTILGLNTTIAPGGSKTEEPPVVPPPTK